MGPRRVRVHGGGRDGAILLASQEYRFDILGGGYKLLSEVGNIDTAVGRLVDIKGVPTIACEQIEDLLVVNLQ